MKLSHTAKETYLTCPKKWELYYKEKLRSTQVGSALFFGLSIDEALNRMLLEKKKKLTEEEQLLMNRSPENIFKNYFTKVKILDDYIDITKSSQATYFKSDLDTSMLEPSDYSNIINHAQQSDINLQNAADVLTFIEEAQMEMKRGLDENTQSVYNYICWLSLYRKGLMLIEAYRQQIMPQIEEVFDVQKRISLPDGEDEFIGVIDVICSFVDNPGIKYICDNKTSSRAFKPDSVATSEQLAAYSEYEDISNCAFIVVEKKIRKREPRVRCNIIKDTMPIATVDDTFDKLTSVFHNINEGNFEKDYDSCFQYGRRCDYYNNCRTGDLTNLKYLKPKENKDGNKEGTRRASKASQEQSEGTE